jgi:hypothetical protein
MIGFFKKKFAPLHHLLFVFPEIIVFLPAKKQQS